MLYHKNTGNSIQNLEMAHQELVAFFNGMDEVFFSVDSVNFRVIQISNGCERLYGYKPAEFLANNRLWFELMHPEDRHIVADDDDILEHGGKVNKQYRIIRKDKTVRWVENKIIPTLDENGKLIRIDGIIWDITARKGAEEKQKQDEARYRQIVETAQEGIWTIDANEKTNFVNKKICEMLGYTPEEMMGKELYDFMDAEGKEYAMECMERRRNGVKENLDIRYVTKGGEDLWANISANPIFDATGNYEGSLAMVTDITKRRIDEKAVKKSEANLRAIFDNTDSAYILIGNELTIISFNALAQRYSEEINGQTLGTGAHISNYFSEERWLFIKEIIARAAAGENVGYELSHTKSDGSVIWNKVRWLNVKNSENKSWGFILVNKDITEEKIAALELERITADLIQHIKDLEQFTYIISHNLRAPVANIIGLSDMLGEPDLDPDMKRAVVERVSASIKNIDTIIQDLNHILQARELMIEKRETVYFNELVETIKTSIHNTVVDEKVQFDCCFDEVEAMFTIRSYLYSIFYNLASNSIKYRQVGVAPVISIKSYKVGDKIELRFKDNGKGIDLDKNAGELFGLYKRFDTTMEGKGMGLFMVKTQVGSLGGTIQIKSKLGEGTEFVIQFDMN